MANLITLREYKNYKAINSDKQDTKISQLIRSVSDYVSLYCDRKFTDYFTTSKVDYFDGTLKQVVLSEFPIQNVSIVKTSVDGGVTQVTLVENTDYFVDLDNDSIISKFDYFVSTSIKHKSLEVTYTAGYKQIPDDLRLAIIELVDYYKDEEYKPRKASGPNINGNTLLVDSKIPVHIKSILDAYRSI